LTLTSEEISELKTAFNLYQLADWQGLHRKVESRVFGDPSTSLVAKLMKRSLAELDDLENANELSLCLHGFYLYYQARYDAAFRVFVLAWQRQSGWGSWSALGLGKIYSDLGCWTQARLWLCESLRIARQDADFARMAECHGALGEVFLRAQYPTEAYELFSTDAALLPPGSGERFRLKNYQALCLGRLGRPELAEPMLWEGYHCAKTVDQHGVSAQFSLASLMTLSVLNRDRSLYERVKIAQETAAPGETGEPIPEMPRGVMWICDAAWCWLSGVDLSPDGEARAKLNRDGLSALDSASRCFEARYPMEHRWVISLVERWKDGQQSEESESAWAELSARAERVSGLVPGEPPSILERWALAPDLNGANLVDSLSSGDVSEAWDKLRFLMI